MRRPYRSAVDQTNEKAVGSEEEVVMLQNWCRPAAYVRCFDEAGRVLLTRFEKDGNADSGSWTMPGGGMEFGESPEQTAHREFFEETGLTISLGAVIGHQSTWFDEHESFLGQPGQALAIVFAGHDPIGELRTDFSDDDTTTDAAWFTVAEVADLRRVPLVDLALSFDA